VGEFSGAFAKACRDRFPTEITLTVDYRHAEHSLGLHYCGDVRDVLWRHRWRLLIGHPPCAKAARSNTTGLDERLEDGTIWFSMAFALMLYTAPADTAIIEQPPSWLEEAYRPPDKRLQFLDYGVAYSKEWLLWTRGGDFLTPPKTTPGASASAPAAHRIQHFNKDERERLRSITPPELAAAICGSVILGAAPPSPQPIMSEELDRLAIGYRATFGTEPPLGWDSPLALPPQGGGADPPLVPGCRRRRTSGADASPLASQPTLGAGSGTTLEGGMAPPRQRYEVTARRRPPGHPHATSRAHLARA